MSCWEVRWSNSRQLPYFYNTSSGQSVWEPPTGLSNEQLKSLPGAHYFGGGGSGGTGGTKKEKVRASHLLVKHSGSRRPSSWKEVSFRRFGDSDRGHLAFAL